MGSYLSLTTFQESMRIMEQIGTIETTDGAGLLRQFGEAKQACGDLAGALECFEKAMSIRRQTSSLETPGGVALQDCVANVKHALRVLQRQTMSVLEEGQLRHLETGYPMEITWHGL